MVQALASVATVVLVVLTWQQVRLVRRQATTTFEDNLTAQYRKIMKDIPTDVWLEAQCIDPVASIPTRTGPGSEE